MGMSFLKTAGDGECRGAERGHDPEPLGADRPRACPRRGSARRSRRRSDLSAIVPQSLLRTWPRGLPATRPGPARRLPPKLVRDQPLRAAIAAASMLRALVLDF